MIKLAPSILSADFVNLQRDIDALAKAGADYVHVDVMDGAFVPNITIGMPVVAAIRRITDLPLDVHLMIDRPVRYVEEFCKAGADIVTIHVEADTLEHNLQALQIIRQAGVRAAISVKPKTPAEAVAPYLELVDLILVMTVEPGFGGQKLQEWPLKKVRTLKAHFPNLLIEVDGGINLENAHIVREAGTDVLIAGTAVFTAKDPEQAIRQLRGEPV